MPCALRLVPYFVEGVKKEKEKRLRHQRNGENGQVAQCMDGDRDIPVQHM